MDKFIDKQIRKLSFQYIMGSPTRVLTEEDCKILIEKFCKAQRNACLRIYESNWERQYMTELIKNAEITKEDYE